MRDNKSQKAESDPQEPGLTHKQEQAIAALLAQPTIKAAAVAAGISEATMWRWLQQNEFHTAFMQARRESVRHAVARLQSTVGDAVDTLAKIMKNAKAPYSARVTAARAVIEYSLKATELEDLAERVAELEYLFEQQQKRAS